MRNSSNNVLTQILTGNTLLDETKTITFIPRENADLKLIENLEIKIKVSNPYSKEFTIPITIVDNKVWNYDYAGGVQTFTAPIAGNYKIELWGAEGGNYTGMSGGKGAYTTGILNLTENESLTLSIGGKGTQSAESETFTSGGYNGGGKANYLAGTGGGATDIRFGGTALNDRIMVAAGGGGSGVFANTLSGGAGGTFIGITGGNHTSDTYKDMHAGTGGTQISGGEAGTYWTGAARDEAYLGTDGSFGTGGTGGYEISFTQGAGAGGGGYYGGGRR